MPYISPSIEKEYFPKVHFSQYILTENKPDDNEPAEAPPQPEHPEAE